MVSKSAARSCGLGRFVVSLVAMGFAHELWAATLIVDVGGAGDYTDIQSALDAASDGDTVLVRPGVYVAEERLNFNRHFDPNDPERPLKNLILRASAGRDKTTIRLEDSVARTTRQQILLFQNGESRASVVQGFTFTGARTDEPRDTTGDAVNQNGGAIGIFYRSHPTIRGCRFEGNRAWRGGAIGCYDRCEPLIEDCEMLGNPAYGEILVWRSSPTIERCEFRGGDFTESSAVFVAGASPGFEGTVSRPTLDSCTIRDMTVGITTSSTTEITVRNCIFEDNGTGISLSRGQQQQPFRMSDSIVRRNRSHGVLSQGAPLELVDCEIVENGGAGAVLFGNDLFRRVRVSWNRGPGLAGTGANSTLEHCVISRNGGGINTTSVSTFVHSTIAFNLGSLQGSRATLNFEDSIIYGNDGVFDDPSSVDVTNCLIDVPGDDGSLYPGDGNFDADPAFCGWDGLNEVFVDFEGSDENNGALRRPFATLRRAFESSLALSASSPCIGAALDGSNVGALGVECDESNSPAPSIVNVGPGTFDGIRQPIDWPIDLNGAGPTDTTLNTSVSVVAPDVEISGFRIESSSYYGLRVRTSDPLKVSNLVLVAAERTDIVASPFGTRIPTGVVVEAGAHAYLKEVRVEEFPRNGIECSDGSELQLEDCTVAKTRSTGIFVNHGATLRMSGGEVTEGETLGVHFVTGSAGRLDGVTIRGNVRAGLKASGASPELDSCIIIENSNREGGGGIRLESGSNLRAVNCLIARNEAPFGGGVSAGRDCEPVFVNCTIADNVSQGESGGVRSEFNSRPTLRNTIVWGNQNGSHSGLFLRATHCVIEGDEVFPGEGNRRGDPLFVGDGDYRLQVGSPAIDAGTGDDAPETDIAGRERVCANDVGAFETGCRAVSGTRFRRGDANGDGRVDISDSIAVLSYLFLGGPEPECLDAADTDDSGSLNITDGHAINVYLFLGGTAFPSPGPFGCGPDSTPDAVTCATSNCSV
ncbi:MAG: right-handed parallel beta-helix repeat-containing protein [Planctomycetota bacterium]